MVKHITTNQIILVNMLQSHMYFIQYCIIKCVGFETIHYIINLDVVSFSIVFSEFNYLFLFDILSF